MSDGLETRISVIEVASKINQENIMKDISDIKKMLGDFISESKRNFATKEELSVLDCEVNKHSSLLTKITRGVVSGLITIVIGLIVFIYKSNIH